MDNKMVMSKILLETNFTRVSSNIARQAIMPRFTAMNNYNTFSRLLLSLLLLFCCRGRGRCCCCCCCCVSVPLFLFTPQYPSEALMEAGLVLRYRMLLNQSPRLIRDRKRDNRTVSKCFIGSEAVDWLTRISPMVHGRFHAIAMLQALLEAAVITHGKNWCLAVCQHSFSLGRAGSSIFIAAFYRPNLHFAGEF